MASTSHLHLVCPRCKLAQLKLQADLLLQCVFSPKVSHVGVCHLFGTAHTPQLLKGLSLSWQCGEYHTKGSVEQFGALRSVSPEPRRHGKKISYVMAQ